VRAGFRRLSASWNTARVTAIDRTHMARTLATGLTELAGEWRADGETVHSQGSPKIVVADLHGGEQSPSHTDIGVALNPDDPAAPVIWDCAAGIGETPEEVAETAAYMWLQTTGSAVIELLTQQGEFAAHLSHDDPDGLPGHHVIHAPILPFGLDGAAMREWIEDNALLPALRDTLPSGLDQELNGVKLLFGGPAGGETAEVRVNGEIHEGASAALRELPWPRTGNPTFAKTFLLVFADSHD
jgi:hypothetical protein